MQKNQPQKFEPSQPPTPEMAKDGFWMITCPRGNTVNREDDFAVMVSCQTAQTAKEMAQTFIHKSTSELRARFWSREEFMFQQDREEEVPLEEMAIPEQFACFGVQNKYLFVPKLKSSCMHSSTFYEVEVPSWCRDVWRMGLLK